MVKSDPNIFLQVMETNEIWAPIKFVVYCPFPVPQVVVDFFFSGNRLEWIGKVQNQIQLSSIFFKVSFMNNITK